MSEPSRAPRRRIEVSLFLALLVSYAYFFQGGGWHQNSRLDLVRAVGEDGSVRIDRFRENTADWARVEDRFLSNKWPGLSFLAVPVYLATRDLVAAFGDRLGPVHGASLQLHLLVIFTVSIASAILAVVLLRFLRGWAPDLSAAALPSVIAYSLGTLAFPWSTQFMAHQAGAALLFGGGALIFTQRRKGWAGGRRPLWMAGALLGVAGIVEETAVFVVPVLLAYVVWTGGWRRFGAVCLGALGPALLHLSYNAAAFGGPLRSARDFQNPRFLAEDSGLIFGVLGLPDPWLLLELTFLPRRGIFFYCPILLFALAGLVQGIRKEKTRPEAVASMAVFGVLLLFNASFNGWHGGWSTGARYLVPALPFLATGLIFLPPTLRPLAWVAGGISVVLMLGITAVNVSVPQDLANARALGITEDVRDPLRNYILPSLAKGDLSRHSQHVDELIPGQMLNPGERRWASYNLGEAAGLHGLTSLLPLVLLWGGFAFVVRLSGRGKGDDSGPDSGGRRHES